MARRKAQGGAAAPSFEEALARLETIVRELEQTDLPLDRSLAVFEEGVLLSRSLHERLSEAERKVEILLKNDEGRKVPVPFPTGAHRLAAADRADEGDEKDGGEDAGETDGDDAGDDGGSDEKEGGGSAGGHGQSRLPF